MGVNTQRGADCPICVQAGTDPPGRTAYVAMIPYVTGEGQSLAIVQPHRYAVCRGCYFAQWAEVYPDVAPPELDEMPRRGKSRPPVPQVEAPSPEPQVETA